MTVSFNPVAFHIGSWPVYWYGISYMVGILLGWRYCLWGVRYSPFSLPQKAFDDFIGWAVIGVIIGGRLGYAVFYQPQSYLQNPLSLFSTWKGGMSFHGGLIGMGLSLLLYTRLKKILFLPFADLIASAAPIGLLFGRLANFINSELYGRVTTSILGIYFPNGGVLPRHPSQLYEALLEGLLLFLFLLFLIRGKEVLRFPGKLSGFFLIGYGLSRFLVEFVREPDTFLGYIIGPLTMGQLLTLPLFALGIFLIAFSKRQRIKEIVH